MKASAKKQKSQLPSTSDDRKSRLVTTLVTENEFNKDYKVSSESFLSVSAMKESIVNSDWDTRSSRRHNIDSQDRLSPNSIPLPPSQSLTNIMSSLSDDANISLELLSRFEECSSVTQSTKPRATFRSTSPCLRCSRLLAIYALL